MTDTPGWTYVDDTMSFLHESGHMVVWNAVAGGWFGYVRMSANNDSLEAHKLGPFYSATSAILATTAKAGRFEVQRNSYQRARAGV